MEAAHLPWQHLGSLLINRGLLSADQVKQAFEEQTLTGKRLGEIVVAHELGLAQDLAKALADQNGLEYVDLSETDLDLDAAMLLPKELAGRYQAVPVRFIGDDLLLVAVADPTDIGRADDLRLALGHNVRLAVSEPADLERTIKRLYRTQIEVVETETEAPELTFNPIAQREDIAESSDDTPAVKLVHATLAQAIEDGASDIHFEPQEADMIVRARIDGVTRQVRPDPEADAARRDQPPEDHGQPGHRRAARAAGRPRRRSASTATRSTCASRSCRPRYGEQVVLRIMHRAVSKPDLGELGMTDAAREHFEKAIRQPYGAVVVCGPTGSGKTTTLYTALHLLNDPGHVVMTIEDPVEDQIRGINHIEISPKSGLTFARGLRTILRSDPDVLLVGEIRDEETAAIAMQAGMTGHLVLTTVHAHNAASAIERLKDMGVEPGLLANVGQLHRRAAARPAALHRLPRGVLADRRGARVDWACSSGRARSTCTARRAAGAAAAPATADASRSTR